MDAGSSTDAVVVVWRQAIGHSGQFLALSAVMIGNAAGVAIGLHFSQRALSWVALTLAFVMGGIAAVSGQTPH